MKLMKNYMCVLETVRAPIGKSCMRAVLIMAPDIGSAARIFERSAAFRELLPASAVKTSEEYDSLYRLAWFNDMSNATSWMMRITQLHDNPMEVNK